VVDFLPFDQIQVLDLAIGFHSTLARKVIAIDAFSVSLLILVGGLVLFALDLPQKSLPLIQTSADLSHVLNPKLDELTKAEVFLLSGLLLD